MQHHIPTYPTPEIPLAPVLSSFRIQETHASGIPSLLQADSIRHVTSGRSAIALALETSHVGSGDTVLAPAYHCESMISPIRWTGARPVFYPVKSDTTLDIEVIRKLLTPEVKAIIVTHYFGFLQDLAPIRALCDERGVILVEDCAHAFFGSRGGRPVGYYGDFAIASTMKFFPVYDGGCLASRSRDLGSIDLGKPNWKFQLKSALVPLERSSSYQRFPVASKIFGLLLALKNLVWAALKRLLQSDSAPQLNPPASDGTQGLDPEWIHVECSRASQLVLHRSDFARIAQRRRQNYQRLFRELGQLPDCRPLFKHLPDGVVPLVFPLYVSKPENHFDELKRKGVPIWRFGEFLDEAVNDELCPNSVDLSAHVFQFPCHQELREEELTWLIKQIQQSFKTG